MIYEEKLYKIIGERLAVGRNKKGLTQDALAEAVKLERTSITNIEAGRQRAPLSLLFRLCEELGIEPSSILPSYKDVVENHVVSLEVGDKNANVSVSISGAKEDVSEGIYKKIEQLMQKI